jgi:hypothetical protein
MSKFVRYLFVILLAAPDASAATVCVHQLPSSIDTTSDLRRHMEGMLQRSITFRQQCQKLARADLHVRIRSDATLADRPYRAFSVIQRLPSGFTACVAITPFGDPTPWIAHEIEHIIEQIEGVRVPALAEDGGGRLAWRWAGNMYETRRAIQAGRIVQREVRDAARALAGAGTAVKASGSGDD